MDRQVDTQKYLEFVDGVTSQESKDYISFNSRCFQIQSVESGDGLPVHRLLTAALGICLLYTSPSPRDRTRSRMPSSA